MKAILECRGLWKAYKDRTTFGIKNLLLGKTPIRKFDRYSREWALQDVAFQAFPGEGFAVVGQNGSGKSTLLSLLLGSIGPDRGSIQRPERIGALLELGAGFHPDLSGRENVILYSSILGISLKEARERFDSIVSFSELGQAIDKPLRTYSSGMIARLGFSTIIHTPAKLILIDEVMAVGDAGFQEKCIDKLIHFKRNGGSLVVVSHDLLHLSKICERGIFIDEGKVVKSGRIDETLGTFQEKMRRAH